MSRLLYLTPLKGGATGPTFIVATGGTITTNGNMKVHTFTSSGTFQITSGIGTVTSLIVAGGGAGGSGGKIVIKYHTGNSFIGTIYYNGGAGGSWAGQGRGVNPLLDGGNGATGSISSSMY